ncbi:MAG: FKBP-type peptidyl-prolyl cis-trans isomerase [Flavobacteriaceae bacterium]
MKYLNKFVFIGMLGLIAIGCNNDEEDVHDPVEQAIIDDEAIVSYLQSHYYDDSEMEIDSITDGQTSLYDDPRMIVDNVNQNDIDYKLYVLQLEAGGDDTLAESPETGENISPSTVDSVFTKYTGFLMSTGYEFDSNDNIWFRLDEVVKGWAYGYTHFTSGFNTSVVDQPLSFEKTGHGYLFIPSGLGYGNNFVNSIPENANLAFEIELKLAFWRDHDGDGTLSKDEDVNGDRDLTDDDTDGDGIPDYVDPDNP